MGLSSCNLQFVKADNSVFYYKNINTFPTSITLEYDTIRVFLQGGTPPQTGDVQISLADANIQVGLVAKVGEMDNKVDYVVQDLNETLSELCTRQSYLLNTTGVITEIQSTAWRSSDYIRASDILSYKTYIDTTNKPIISFYKTAALSSFVGQLTITAAGEQSGINIKLPSTVLEYDTIRVFLQGGTPSQTGDVQISLADANIQVGLVAKVGEMDNKVDYVVQDLNESVEGINEVLEGVDNSVVIDNPIAANTETLYVPLFIGINTDELVWCGSTPEVTGMFRLFELSTPSSILLTSPILSFKSERISAKSAWFRILFHLVKSVQVVLSIPWY